MSHFITSPHPSTVLVSSNLRVRDLGTNRRTPHTRRAYGRTPKTAPEVGAAAPEEPKLFGLREAGGTGNGTLSQTSESERFHTRVWCV